MRQRFHVELRARLFRSTVGIKAAWMYRIKSHHMSIYVGLSHLFQSSGASIVDTLVLELEVLSCTAFVWD